MYVDLTQDGQKALQNASLMSYRNRLLESPRETSLSRSKELSLKMKFHSNLKIGHDQDEEEEVQTREASSTRFSQSVKEKVWNEYYASNNESEIGRTAYRRIDTPEKSEAILIEESKKGVEMRNEFLKSSFQQQTYIGKI